MVNHVLKQGEQWTPPVHVDAGLGHTSLILPKMYLGKRSLSHFIVCVRARSVLIEPLGIHYAQLDVGLDYSLEKILICRRYRFTTQDLQL